MSAKRIRLRAVIEWDEDPADWGTLLPHQIASTIASDEDYLTALLIGEGIPGVEVRVEQVEEGA